MDVYSIILLHLLSWSFYLDFSQATDLRQSKDLLPNGRLKLSWGVSQDRISFKIVAKGSKSVSFLFSYNDVPTDGFQAGLDDNAKFFLFDLHLDFAGRDLSILISLFIYLVDCRFQRASLPLGQGQERRFSY